LFDIIFHDLSIFGMLLLGARIAQFMASDCIDVSCHQSGRVGCDEFIGPRMNTIRIDYIMVGRIILEVDIELFYSSYWRSVSSMTG